MGRKSQYSPLQWEAYARGENLAETSRPMRLPTGLSAYEQTAFRDGYQTRSADIKNRPLVDEIKRMVSPLPIKRLFLSLAHRS
jgi:hypothetical protein